MTTLSRRGLLVGAAGAATLAATSTPLQTPAIALTARPLAADWNALARACIGPVFLPGSSAYETNRLVFNPRFDGARPLAVVQPVRQADVQAVLAFARRYALKVTPRGGGHSYVGASAAAGHIALDMRRFAGITTVSATSATVYAGSSIYPIKAALAARGQGIATGTCPTVGLSGLTLGGGIGVESRAYGMTCDAVTAMTVVTGTGAAMRISPTAHGDLFWALRGGGGGFGAIVTSLTFRTHPVSSQGVFRLVFAPSRAVLTGWARWISTTTTRRWANLHVESDRRGGVRVVILGVGPAGDERAAAASLIATIGANPVSSSYRTGSYLDTARYLGGGTTTARTPFSAGSDVIAGMSTSTADAILGTVRARSRAGLGGVAILDPLTGAVRSTGSTATAFPWRRHLAIVQWYAGGTGYSSASAWIRSGHAALGSASSGHYVNYAEPGMTAVDYLAGNATRWRQVIPAYDPAHLI